MLKEEIKQIKSGPKELKEFGLIVGTAFIVLGGVLWHFKGVSFLPFACLGTVLVLFGLFLSSWLKGPQKIWMTLALCIGWVVSRALMSLLFFVLMTPLGLGLKLSGKHLLELGIQPKASTYWKKREKDINRKSCENQF